MDHTEARARIHRSTEPFALTPKIAAFSDEALRLQIRRRRLLRKRLSDEPNLRIRQVTGTSPRTLHLQEVSYFMAIRTNLSLDYRPRGRTQSLRELVQNGDRLPAFEDSLLADHLGVNALLFTADRQLIVGVRSRRTLLRPGELAPSSSGAVSLHDARTGRGTLGGMEWFRESIEERGVRLEDIDDYRFLGLAREMIRGGKPELFYAVRTRLSLAAVRERQATARDSWEWSGAELLVPFSVDPLTPLAARDQHLFFLELDRFLEQHQRKASWPLLAALALWTDTVMSVA